MRSIIRSILREGDATGASGARTRFARLRRAPARHIAPLAAALAALAPAHAVAAPPAPCGGVPQIADAVGDGHHPPTDVVSAWFSEESGGLQAVVQVRSATWVPEHPDAEVVGSAVAVVYRAGGVTRYVRALASLTGVVTYDHGTYAGVGGFTSAGATTGRVEYGTNGTVTIDVPADAGAVAGATLSGPVVITYDGINAGVYTWVDHAPGGELPTDPAVGADYVVGACAPGGGGGQAVTAVRISSPARVTGARTVTVSGRVVPAIGGVGVDVTRTTARGSAVSRVTTAADGRWTLRIPVSETTRLRATAGAIGSQTTTVTVRSTVTFAVRRTPSGATVVSGRVSPALPGRVLLLPATSVVPTATVAASRGRYAVVLRTVARGRYQAVFIPSGGRAERSTSPTGVIR